MQERFPMPRFFVTKPGDSNERKIKNRVNPSSLTANNATVEVRPEYFLININIEWQLYHRRCQFKCVYVASYPYGRPVVKELMPYTYIVFSLI
jgi:hypothetical protein